MRRRKVLATAAGLGIGTGIASKTTAASTGPIDGVGGEIIDEDHAEIAEKIKFDAKANITDFAASAWLTDSDEVQDSYWLLVGTMSKRFWDVDREYAGFQYVYPRTNGTNAYEVTNIFNAYPGVDYEATISNASVEDIAMDEMEGLEPDTGGGTDLPTNTAEWMADTIASETGGRAWTGIEGLYAIYQDYAEITGTGGGTDPVEYSYREPTPSGESIVRTFTQTRLEYDYDWASTDVDIELEVPELSLGPGPGPEDTLPEAELSLSVSD